MQNLRAGHSWVNSCEATTHCKRVLKILRLCITNSFTYTEEQIKTIYLQLEEITELPTDADAGTFHREYFIPPVNGC